MAMTLPYGYNAGGNEQSSNPETFPGPVSFVSGFVSGKSPLLVALGVGYPLTPKVFSFFRLCRPGKASCVPFMGLSPNKQTCVCKLYMSAVYCKAP